MISTTPRRWRTLPRRARAAAFLLAAVALWFAVGSALRWWGDTWPARAVLRTPEAALPLAFSPDGRTFLTYGRGGITPWDARLAREGPTWTFKNGGHPELGVFSPDGKAYAAGVFAFPGPLSIDLFDADTGRARASFATKRRTLMHLAFAPDGRTLRAFLGDDPQFPRDCVSWNPGYAADLLEVVTLDAATGVQLASRPLAAPTRQGITAIAPDGRVMAIADRSRVVQLWDLDQDRTLGTLTNPAATPSNPVGGAGLGFSDDGRTLAVGRIDGSVELWDVAGRRLLKTLPRGRGYFVFTAIRFSPDGRTLALAGYRVEDSPFKKVEDHVRQVLQLGQKMDPELIVRDVATGRRLARAADSTRPIFSPDGRTLATQEPDGSTRLRDVPRP